MEEICIILTAMSILFALIWVFSREWPNYPDDSDNN